MSLYLSTTVRTSLRDRVANTLVAAGKPVYTLMRFRRKPWPLTKEDLQNYASGTLGHDLYCFLEMHHFELMPRAEFHDIFHVLLQMSTNMRDETSIQFVVIGNGKWSLPNLVSSGVALVFYPEHWSTYRKAYQRGKSARTFYDAPFLQLLEQPTTELRAHFGLA